MINSFGEVLENVDLTNYNSYKIKTSCKYLINVLDEIKLSELINYLKEEKISYKILGNGTNVILPDNYFDGVIIKLDKLNKIEINDNDLYIESGVNLGFLVNTLINNKIVNLTFLGNIPGTVGGAIIQNAGCYNKEIFDYVKSVKVLDDGIIKTLDKSEIKYEYRNTSFKNSDIIILGATLISVKGSKEEALQELKENTLKRVTTQPLKYPNAGSVFKNPEGYSAGKLIDDAGLKGKSVGGACVSDIHANFIINKDCATSSDIKNLIKVIQEKVVKEKNVKLELEQEIVEW